MWYIIAGVVVAVVAFVWWRYTSVERGARRVRELILKELDPIGERIGAQEEVSEEEVKEYADKNYLRPFLYNALKHFERLDLFPKEYLTNEAQAESILAYWLMHPNELQTCPEIMVLLETVPQVLDNQNTNFYVFKYKMEKGHWAHKDGWLLGLAGPFFEKDIPYSGIPLAFSLCTDKEGCITPKDLVDRFVTMVEGRS